MLGLVDSVALAPLALAATVFSGAGIGVRAGLAVVAAAGVAAAALILALPRLAVSKRALRFRLGRWPGPRTTSRRDGMETTGCNRAKKQFCQTWRKRFDLTDSAAR
jgi:uncharacterized membrane protein YhiD involved in acid resistance